MQCEWCEKEIEGWYLIYKGKNFCRRNDDKCIKEYLYEQEDENIDMDYLLSEDQIKMEALIARRMR